MVTIVSGTSRPGSNTLKVASILADIYAELGIGACLLDLEALCDGQDDPGDNPEGMKEAVDAINSSKGIIILAPEYNGEIPNALKFFLTRLKERINLQARPLCLVGISASEEAARGPVEQVRQFFGERNGYIYPVRLYVHGLPAGFQGRQDFGDPMQEKRLRKQAEGFIGFITRMRGSIGKK